MRRAARAADPGNALTVAQLELLSCVAENPGSRPGQIARRLRIAPNSVTTLVNALCSRDLLVRSGGRADRRSVTLSLTPAGRRAVTGWHATNTAILRSAMAELPLAQQDLLAAALPALHDLIQAIDAQADPTTKPDPTTRPDPTTKPAGPKPNRGSGPATEPTPGRGSDPAGTPP